MPRPRTLHPLHGQIDGDLIDVLHRRPHGLGRRAHEVREARETAPVVSGPTRITSSNAWVNWDRIRAR
jgi:hypothetical protein